MRVLLIALALGWATALGAQRAADHDHSADPRYVAPSPVLELRAVLPVGDDPEFQFGPGVNIRAGWYVRASLAVLGGAVRRDTVTVGLARIEGAVRFHLDPFFEAPGCRRLSPGAVCKGIYGGVGLSQRFLGSGIGADDPALLFLIGVEGRRRASGVWAAELGVGGGLRLGATWRRSRSDGFR
jgi:hypothetical protein